MDTPCLFNVSNKDGEENKICISIRTKDGVVIRVEVDHAEFSKTLVSGSTVDAKITRWKLENAQIKEIAKPPVLTAAQRAILAEDDTY